jgi:hypothetical protein
MIEEIEEEVNDKNEEEIEEEINQIAALNHYKAHKSAVKRYTDANREEIYRRNRKYYAEVMADPERRERYNQTKRNAYKAKKERLKNLSENK